MRVWLRVLSVPKRYLLNTLEDTMTPEPLGGGPTKPRRRGRLRQVVTGLSILIVGLVAFAWPQGGVDGDNGSLNAVAMAAERTQREPGGRSTMHAVVSSPERPESLTITGQTVYDAEDRSRGVVTTPPSESDHPFEMDVITDGAVMYMHSSQFGSLPGGGEWMKLDLSFGEELDTPVPVTGDPKGELEILEGVTGVRNLGKEDVRGVPTTHYRGTIGASEKEGSPLPLEVWIDADGLVRRMRMVQSQPQDGGGSTTIDMRIDFFDFGIEPEIDVPDPGEVFDATALAQNEARHLNGD
jgi:hypothetical protein